jgi:hypothetical protein
MRNNGRGEGITFSLFGIPDNALERLAERIFWMMVEAAATPQTMPMERKRYTIDVDTACSIAPLVLVPKPTDSGTCGIVRKPQYS